MVFHLFWRARTFEYLMNAMASVTTIYMCTPNCIHRCSRWSLGSLSTWPVMEAPNGWSMWRKEKCLWVEGSRSIWAKCEQFESCLQGTSGQFLRAKHFTWETSRSAQRREDSWLCAGHLGRRGETVPKNLNGNVFKSRSSLQSCPSTPRWSLCWRKNDQLLFKANN